jgi:hypothetical protein
MNKKVQVLVKVKIKIKTKNVIPTTLRFRILLIECHWHQDKIN